MFEIGIIALLILLNGFFAMSEMSVVTARKARLRHLADDSASARSALELAEQPERFLSTVQVGITLIGILTGTFGGVAVGAMIGGWLAPVISDPEVALGVGTAVGVTVITYFTIIFGELLPKRIALRAPERLAMAVALPMRLIASATLPFVWLLSVSVRLVLRALRLEDAGAQKVTEEEIRLLVAEGHEHGAIDVDERNMVNRVLRLGDRSAESLMTPRNRIVWLDATDSVEENLAVMRETPHSRYPVFRGDDKDVMGVLEVKSLAGRITTGQLDLFAELTRPLYVSESTRALHLLDIFREQQLTQALVVDEYGEIQGLVTLNDLLAAVLGRVGQLDHASTQPGPVTRRDDGSLLVDGSIASEDLRELLSLGSLPGEEDADYNTAAGMIISQFGRIPEPGEHLTWKGWRIEVVDLDGARIDKLLIQEVAAEDAAPTAEDGSNS